MSYFVRIIRLGTMLYLYILILPVTKGLVPKHFIFCNNTVALFQYKCLEPKPTIQQSSGPTPR